jgi:hypothetical protein
MILIATNGGPGFPGSQALYFAGSGNRTATTIPLDVSQGATIEFSLRGGNESVDGSLWNDIEDGEEVVLEYSNDNGASWDYLHVAYSRYPERKGWGKTAIELPFYVVGIKVQFRWRQLAAR